MAGIFTRSLRVVAILAVGLTVSGCSRIFSSNCNKPAAYASAQSLPPLQVPVGLDSPDRRASLKIPELNTPEVPRGKGDPCLDEPPKYSSTANLSKGVAGAAPTPAPEKKKHWWSRK